ncbi:hypothetical protein GA0070619_1736 [Micromonospora zamorensis]|nr:hypothetical protein GA0070619_1736 [Micromonospora zamorensis]
MQAVLPYNQRRALKHGCRELGFDLLEHEPQQSRQQRGRGGTPAVL